MCLPQAAMALDMHLATRGGRPAEPQPTLTPAARRDFGETKSASHRNRSLSLSSEPSLGQSPQHEHLEPENHPTI